MLGQPIRRLEDDRLIFGRGRYLDDRNALGQYHLRLERSNVPNGRVVDIRVGEQAPLPRGALVVTGKDVDLAVHTIVDLPMAHEAPQPVLAGERVRFVGEPVVAVLHPDPYTVEDAAEAVTVDIEPHEPVTGILEALEPGSSRVHDDWPDNIHVRRIQRYGDLDAARAEANRSVRRVFRTNRQAGVPLENRGCLAVPEPDGRLTLWSSTQVPHLVRTYVAAELGMPEHSLRVVAPDVGGGFGVKGHVFGEEVLVAWLARELGAPVKWVEDRREHLLASIHGRDHLHAVEALVTDDGKVLGIRVQLLVDAGAYSVFPWSAGSDSGMAAKVLLGPYDIQHYEVEDIAVATNKCPLGTYRGVGRPSAVFTMERLMDEIGRELDLDPVEVRRRNVIRSFPYRTANGLPLDSGSYAESLDVIEREVDIPALRREQEGRSADSRAIGIGIALFNEQTAHGTPDFTPRRVPIESGYESVTVSMDAHGLVSVLTGLQSHGQSHETTFAQVAAHELRVPVESVRVQHGDTATSAYTVGTWGSRGAVLGGGATARAARRLRAKLFGIAAHELGVSTEDLELRDGGVGVRGKPDEVTMAQLGYWANRQVAKLPEGMEPGLHATVFLDGPERGTHSNSCHAAVVEVDRDTGKVRLLRYVVVEDCGVMINPMVVDGQVHGGVAQGIGSALLEESVYVEGGQPVSTTFMDYLLPSSQDVPHIEVHHLVTPSPLTEYGMKGMGEAGAIGPMAAVANAVADALGVFVQETPLRMHRVWELLEDHPPRWTFDRLVAVPTLAEFWKGDVDVRRT
ncbi:MAG TPA: xanthine dehydrogenase family protein molybdopterin-binding subunit [Egibacteraceae bacterium]|nr:xanthine dehydrogenase family protein molybdopterin-binding subunit [Egibacteraceae bacterium]